MSRHQTPLKDIRCLRKCCFKCQNGEVPRIYSVPFTSLQSSFWGVQRLAQGQFDTERGDGAGELLMTQRRHRLNM